MHDQEDFSEGALVDYFLDLEVLELDLFLSVVLHGACALLGDELGTLGLLHGFLFGCDFLLVIWFGKSVVHLGLELSLVDHDEIEEVVEVLFQAVDVVSALHL